MIFPLTGVFCKAPVRKQTLPFQYMSVHFRLKISCKKTTGKIIFFIVWGEESYRCKFVDWTVFWGDWPSAQWVEKTDPLSVITSGTLIAFSNSNDFVCLSCSKKLSTTCASSSRTLGILREYLRLCHSFRWVWLNGREIWICSPCVLSKSIFMPLQVPGDSCLVTVAFPWLGHWGRRVILEVWYNYILGMVFSFVLHSEDRELCKTEPNQEVAWTRSLWLK